MDPLPSSPPRRPALPAGATAAAVACGVAGIVLFQCLGNSTRSYINTRSLFEWWGTQWINPDSEAEQGPVILLLVIGLIAWNLRRNAPSASISPASTVSAGSAGGRSVGLGSWKTPAALLGGLAVHAAGFVAQQTRLSILGFLLFAWGVIGLGGGPRWRRASAFPLSFMVFAIPLNVLDTFGFWLRMGVVDTALAAAHAAGIAVVRNGTQLLGPGGRYDYDVAAACSGVRSLTALAALSLLVGYFYFRPAWLRAAFLLASGPLVFVGNVVRIGSIIVAAQWGGPVWGDRAHEIMGFGVFAIVLGGVVAAAETLARLRPGWLNPGPRRAGDEEPGGAPPALADPVRGPKRRVLRGPWPLAFAVLACTAAEAAFLVHVERTPLGGFTGVVLAPEGGNPVTLPDFIGADWMGQVSYVTPTERQILPKDTGFSRKRYILLRDPREQVFYSVVLSGHDRTSIHRPEICLVAQGWTITGGTTSRFDVHGPGGRALDFPASVLHIRREVALPQGSRTVNQLVAYAFVGADCIVATHFQRLALDAWNRLVHGRADRWAYILVQADASDGDPAALDRIRQILDGTLPTLLLPQAAASRP